MCTLGNHLVEHDGAIEGRPVDVIVERSCHDCHRQSISSDANLRVQGSVRSVLAAERCGSGAAHVEAERARSAVGCNRVLGTPPMIRSKIPSDTLRILHVLLAVVFSQEPFFAQDLTVEQPNAGHKVDQ